MRHTWKNGYRYGKCHNGYKFDFNLSKSMNSYLRSKILFPKASSTKSTISALVKRDLCTHDGSLTEIGTAVAIRLLPLTGQCDIMNIPLEDLILAIDKRRCPEEAVLHYLESNSEIVYYTENAFGVSVAQFFMFKYQYETALKHEINLYSINFTAGDCQRYFIYEELLSNLDEYIERIDIDTIDENYELIKKLNSQLCLEISISFDENFQVVQPPKNEFAMTYFYQDLDDIGFYKNLYLNMGKEFIGKLIKFIIYNPSVYAVGWPDIFVLDKDPYFVEVKTSDRFHMSQIITMRDVMSELGIPIKCIRVNKTKSKERHTLA